MKMSDLSVAQLRNICHDGALEPKILAQLEILNRLTLSAKMIQYLATQGETDEIKIKAHQRLSTQRIPTSGSLRFLYTHNITEEKKLEVAQKLIGLDSPEIDDLKYLCLGSEFPNIRLQAIHKIIAHKSVSAALLWNISINAKDFAVKETADKALLEKKFAFELTCLEKKFAFTSHHLQN
jgi:hypothetical protein